MDCNIVIGTSSEYHRACPSTNEGPVRLWHQRLADVEARKLLSFKEKNLVAICSEEGRYRGAGGTSAQHHDWAFRGEVSSVHQV